MECVTQIGVNPRDVIGVEIFLINNGIRKEKKKFGILRDYANHLHFVLPSEDKYVWAAYLCQEIQSNFKAFRIWFNQSQITY